jgi:hypothetical protein
MVGGKLFEDEGMYLMGCGTVYGFMDRGVI